MNKLFFLILMVSALSQSCREVENRSLGANYRIHDERGPRNRVIVDNQYIVKVDNHVLEYTYDSTFIVAAQRPWDSIAGIRKLTYNEKQIAFDSSSFRQYWIIDKTNNKIYGPLKEFEFRYIFDSLKVESSLALKKY